VKLERALQGITDLIVHTCNPDVILLFGSYAKGQENPQSDLDVLVIAPFRESPYLRGRELREQLHRYPIHIDLLLYTLEEATFEARKPYGFMSSILSHSVILYQDSDIAGNLLTSAGKRAKK
jgi:predicted nucleotidyltransferase